MDEQRVIGYGTTFVTRFLGMSTTLTVVSPISKPEPEVVVVIEHTYAKGDSIKVSKVSLEGSFFEDLLVILASIRKHADLLSGAEFGFLASFTNDHQAILFSKVGPATVKVLRKKGFLSGKKDIVTITIDDMEITEELSDMFFKEIEKLQSAIAQSKRKVAEKISAYIGNKELNK